MMMTNESNDVFFRTQYFGLRFPSTFTLNGVLQCFEVYCGANFIMKGTIYIIVVA